MILKRTKKKIRSLTPAFSTALRRRVMSKRKPRRSERPMEVGGDGDSWHGKLIDLGVSSSMIDL